MSREEIAVEMNDSSSGVQSFRMAQRYWRRCAGGRIENSWREIDAMDEIRGELGPGDGAGVGGEAMGINSVVEGLAAMSSLLGCEGLSERTRG